MARPNNTASGLAQRSRMPLIILAIILAVVLLAAFMSLRKADMPVRIGHAERGLITASISTNGKVEPVKNFEAHAPGPAIVKLS